MNCEQPQASRQDLTEFTNLQRVVDVLSTRERLIIVQLLWEKGQADMVDCLVAARTSKDFSAGSEHQPPDANPFLYLGGYDVGGYTIVESVETTRTRQIVRLAQQFRQDFPRVLQLQDELLGKGTDGVRLLGQKVNLKAPVSVPLIPVPSNHPQLRQMRSGAGLRVAREKLDLTDIEVLQRLAAENPVLSQKLQDFLEIVSNKPGYRRWLLPTKKLGWEILNILKGYDGGRTAFIRYFHLNPGIASVWQKDIENDERHLAKELHSGKVLTPSSSNTPAAALQ